MLWHILFRANIVDRCDGIVNDFRCGRSAEAIFEAYSSIGSLAKVYGAIAFISEHPAEVEAYLKDQDRILEQIKVQYPVPHDMIDRLERAGKEAPSRLDQTVAE